MYESGPTLRPRARRRPDACNHLACLHGAYRASARPRPRPPRPLERNVGNDARGLFPIATALAENKTLRGAARLFQRSTNCAAHIRGCYTTGVAQYNLTATTTGAARFWPRSMTSPGRRTLSPGLYQRARRQTNAIESASTRSSAARSANITTCRPRVFPRGLLEGAITRRQRMG